MEQVLHRLILLGTTVVVMPGLTRTEAIVASETEKQAPEKKGTEPDIFDKIIADSEALDKTLEEKMKNENGNETDKLEKTLGKNKEEISEVSNEEEVKMLLDLAVNYINESRNRGIPFDLNQRSRSGNSGQLSKQETHKVANMAAGVAPWTTDSLLNEIKNESALELQTRAYHLAALKSWLKGQMIPDDLERLLDKKLKLMFDKHKSETVQSINMTGTEIKQVTEIVAIKRSYREIVNFINKYSGVSLLPAVADSGVVLKRAAMLSLLQGTNKSRKKNILIGTEPLDLNMTDDKLLISAAYELHKIRAQNADSKSNLNRLLDLTAVNGSELAERTVAAAILLTSLKGENIKLYGEHEDGRKLLEGSVQKELSRPAVPNKFLRQLIRVSNNQSKTNDEQQLITILHSVLDLVNIEIAHRNSLGGNLSTIAKARTIPSRPALRISVPVGGQTEPRNSANQMTEIKAKPLSLEVNPNQNPDGGSKTKSTIYSLIIAKPKKGKQNMKINLTGTVATTIAWATLLNYSVVAGPAATDDEIASMKNIVEKMVSDALGLITATDLGDVPDKTNIKLDDIKGWNGKLCESIYKNLVAHSSEVKLARSLVPWFAAVYNIKLSAEAYKEPSECSSSDPSDIEPTFKTPAAAQEFFVRAADKGGILKDIDISTIITNAFYQDETGESLSGGSLAAVALKLKTSLTNKIVGTIKGEPTGAVADVLKTKLEEKKISKICTVLAETLQNNSALATQLASSGGKKEDLLAALGTTYRIGSLIGADRTNLANYLGGIWGAEDLKTIFSDVQIAPSPADDEKKQLTLSCSLEKPHLSQEQLSSALRKLKDVTLGGETLEKKIINALKAKDDKAKTDNAEALITAVASASHNTISPIDVINSDGEKILESIKEKAEEIAKLLSGEPFSEAHLNKIKDDINEEVKQAILSGGYSAILSTEDLGFVATKDISKVSIPTGADNKTIMNLIKDDLRSKIDERLRDALLSNKSPTVIKALKNYIVLPDNGASIKVTAAKRHASLHEVIDSWAVGDINMVRVKELAAIMAVQTGETKKADDIEKMLLQTLKDGLKEGKINKPVYCTDSCATALLRRPLTGGDESITLTLNSPLAQVMASLAGTAGLPFNLKKSSDTGVSLSISMNKLKGFGLATTGQLIASSLRNGLQTDDQQLVVKMLNDIAKTDEGLQNIIKNTFGGGGSSEESELNNKIKDLQSKLDTANYSISVLNELKSAPPSDTKGSEPPETSITEMAVGKAYNLMDDFIKGKKYQDLAENAKAAAINLEFSNSSKTVSINNAGTTYNEILKDLALSTEDVKNLPEGAKKRVLLEYARVKGEVRNSKGKGKWTKEHLPKRIDKAVTASDDQRNLISFYHNKIDNVDKALSKNKPLAEALSDTLFGHQKNIKVIEGALKSMSSSLPTEATDGMTPLDVLNELTIPGQ